VTDAEWPIPNCWEWAGFDDVAVIAQDLVSPNLVPSLPHIAPNHVEGVTGRLLDYRTVAEDEVISPKQRFFPGQIVFSKIRPYLRKAAAVNFEGVCSADMYPLWPRESVEREYLLRWLLSEDFRDASLAHQGRTLLPKINQTGLRSTRLPLPPLPEQRRIVAKLDRLSARSRAARDHLARTAALAARVKQAILAAAFRGELTAEWRELNNPPAITADATKIDNRAPSIEALPQAWSWAALGSLTTVTGGLTKNQKRAGMPLKAPYLRVANVYANELRLSEVLDIGCTVSEAAHTRLQNGDLLVVEGNGSRDQIGRVALWRGEIDGCLHQNHLIRVRPSSEITPEFALYWLLSPSGRIGIEAVASSSSGLHTLSITKVKGLPVPACSVEEQHEIVRRIETAFARIDRLTAEAARAAHLLDRLDERLLAKAFRGELVPQDPADEPARDLLARIRAARVAAPKPKRGRRKKGAA